MAGHVERKDEYRMIRRVLAEVNGGRVQGRPRLGWMDDVKVALGSRGMPVKAARQWAKYRKEWRAILHKYMIEFNAAIFSWPSILLLGSSGLSLEEEWNAVT